jgi:MFS superfamily sulfate permease-like transporter
MTRTKLQRACVNGNKELHGSFMANIAATLFACVGACGITTRIDKDEYAAAIPTS